MTKFYLSNEKADIDIPASDEWDIVFPEYIAPIATTEEVKEMLYNLAQGVDETVSTKTLMNATGYLFNETVNRNWFTRLWWKIRCWL